MAQGTKPGGTLFSFNMVGHNYEYTYPNNVDMHKGGPEFSYFHDDPANGKYNGEQEVLLMPYFMFTILSIKKPEYFIKERKDDFEKYKKDLL